MCGNTVCEIVVTLFVRLCVYGHEPDILYYREKSCVVDFSDEMENLNENDRSRCYIFVRWHVHAGVANCLDVVWKLS